MESLLFHAGLYLLTICINSRTSNFHLFKSRDSLWILLNVVPPSLYSKEAIFQSDSRLNSAQGGEKKKEKTQALSLLATKALREPGFVFFSPPEIEGRIKEGESKKKRLSLARGIQGQMKREAFFPLKRHTRSLLESTVLCGSYNEQQPLFYLSQGPC